MITHLSKGAKPLNNVAYCGTEGTRDFAWQVADITCLACADARSAEVDSEFLQVVENKKAYDKLKRTLRERVEVAAQELIPA